MRNPVCFVVCVILAVCSTCVPAQTSSGFSSAEQYQAIKGIVEQFYDRGLLQSRIGKDPRPDDKFNRPGEYDLFYCVGAAQYLGSFSDHPRDRNLDRLTDLAIVMVVWEHDFRTLRFPDKIWRPVLDRYETASLAGHEEGVDRLAAELNAANARAGRSLPKFVTMGGCGAGEIQVQFTLDPPDGQLFLIPVFLFKLCQAQKLSPTDFKSCDRWKEVFNGTVSYASGDYVYLARWADGVVRCGSLGVNDFHEKQFSKIQITKVRSPECHPAW